MKTPQTEFAKLLHEYAAKRGISQAEIARRVGHSAQSISFLFLGRQGTDASTPYLGLRSRKMGEKPLAFKVADVLKIPEKLVASALLQDQMAMARGTWKGCSTNPEADLLKHIALHHPSAALQAQRAIA